MTASLTDTLCTKCGLCCDGTLFADVELSSSAEVTGLEILGPAEEIKFDHNGDLPGLSFAGKPTMAFSH